MAAHDNGPRPPAALDVEERLLSACLDTDAAVRATRDAGLVADDFYRPLHRAIYARIVELVAISMPHGPVDVRRELDAWPEWAAELDQAGGPAYLHTLYEQRALAAWAATDAAHLADLGRRRRLMDALQVALVAARDPAVPLDATRATLAVRVEAARSEVGHDRTVDGATFCLEGPATVVPIWGDGTNVAWATGESVMLVGPQGVGKTTLAGQLTLARIGLRKDLLGLPVTPTHSRVLYLACDRPQQIRRSFRRMVSEADRESLAERLVVWQGPPLEDLAKHPGILVDLAAQAGADTIVIDSLKDVAADIHKDEGGAGFNRTRQAALAHGIELVELHHQRKGGTDGRKPKALADVYGSTWLTAGVGSVLLLWGDPGDPIVELLHLKQPSEELGPYKLLHDAEHGTTAVLEGADLYDLVKAQPGITAAEAARFIFDIVGTPERKETEKARRKLDALVRRGIVHRRDGSVGGNVKQPARYHAIVPTEPP